MVARSRFQFVFFDVDSTLVTIEGIDELSGKNPEIARLTEAAMNGELAVEQVYARRLEIIRPSRADLAALAEHYRNSLVKGARETVGALREGGADVHLVTAGLAPAIEPLAAYLSIPARAVHAVGVELDGEGRYLDFDRRSLLTRGGGKELVVRSILSRSKGRAAFVGDGVTDLETKSVVDLFVGFGGVHVRARVKENAEVFVEEPDLTAVLAHLLERPNRG